jgi:hypothetical protein
MSDLILLQLLLPVYGNVKTPYFLRGILLYNQVRIISIPSCCSIPFYITIRLSVVKKINYRWDKLKEKRLINADYALGRRYEALKPTESNAYTHQILERKFGKRGMSEGNGDRGGIS